LLLGIVSATDSVISIVTDKVTIKLPTNAVSGNTYSTFNPPTEFSYNNGTATYYTVGLFCSGTETLSVSSYVDKLITGKFSGKVVLINCNSYTLSAGQFTANL